MTTEFFIFIEIRVLGQPILYLTRKGTLVGALVSNPELIKPKWSTTGLNTYDHATVFNLVGFEMQQFLNYKKPESSELGNTGGIHHHPHFTD